MRTVWGPSRQDELDHTEEEMCLVLKGLDHDMGIDDLSEVWTFATFSENDK